MMDIHKEAVVMKATKFCFNGEAGLVYFHVAVYAKSVRLAIVPVRNL